MTSRSQSGTDERVSVLIVGGSLVGLSTALFLRLHGVDCLSVERHTGTAIDPPRATSSCGTVEILRAAGLEDEVRRRSGRRSTGERGINNVESLRHARIRQRFPNL